jgi:lactate dehydrogenase-like 2-hydroxyacid dehydrogenase
MAQVLLTVRFAPQLEAEIARRYGAVGPFEASLQDAVDSLSSDDARAIRAIVSVGTVPIGAAIMDALPSLGLVSCLGSGYEGVDVAAARSRGIAITNGADTNSSSVADLAMGLLIAGVRDMTSAGRRIEQGRWQSSATDHVPATPGLTGRRLGVYGMGAIGTKIARRAAAFEMEVGYHNRHRREDSIHPWFPSLLELARWADVLMIAVRADASNRHAVNAKVLQALGKDGFVVNISRGSVIDEAALTHALSTGVIAGAGLDVFEHEPKVPPELLARRHVALTPHIGGKTREAQKAMQDTVLRNLEAFFAGQPLATPVDAGKAAHR